MTSWRLASSMTSSPAIRRRLSAREPAEHGADRQPESAEVTLRQNISGHDFSRRVHVAKRPAGRIEHPRALVHRHAHVRERDPGAKREAVKWRAIDRQRPVAFLRSNPLRAQAVEALHLRVRVPGRRAIVLRERIYERGGIEAKLRGEISERIG